MHYLQKSSFDVDHVIKYSKHLPNYSELIREIKIPCLTLTDLIKDFWLPDFGNELDIIIIDAEGHELSIFRSIDFDVVKPDAFLFESENLGDNKSQIYHILSKNGYHMNDVGTDCFAIRRY